MPVGQMFDRETRREKILDARHREMKLKERTKSSQEKVSYSWSQPCQLFTIEVRVPRSYTWSQPCQLFTIEVRVQLNQLREMETP